MRRLRLAIAGRLAGFAVRVLPLSPCRVPDWTDHPQCNGDSCPACGTWEHPTGFYRPPARERRRL